MHGFMVFCFIAVTAALPQGYNYQEPDASTPYTAVISHSGHSAYGQQVSDGVAPSYAGVESSEEVAPSHPVAELTAPSSTGAILGGPSSFGSAAVVPSYSAQPEVGIITKNFFTHTAPEETEEDIQEESESTGPTNKKYNVVFVKAPGQSAKSAALALRKAQSNEKNIIYVLSKKLDVSELQNALSTTDSNANKPEVVFIKYKTPAEAQHAQHQIQQQYEALGGGPTYVGDEEVAPVSSVVGSLGSSSGHHHGHIGHHSHAGHAPAASSLHKAGYLPPGYYL